MTKFSSLSVALALIFSCSAGSAQAAGAPPKTMSKFTIRIASPKLQEEFMRPKTLWRAGTGYARMEDTKDEKRHLQLTTIIRDPDVWIVNIYDKTGKHVVSPIDDHRVHMPIFVHSAGKNGENANLEKLEWGNEVAYFNAHKSKIEDGPAVNGEKTKKYTIDVDGGKATLITSAKTDTPIDITYARKGKEMTFHYDFFAANMPYDEKVFKPLPEWKVTEAKLTARNPEKAKATTAPSAAPAQK